MLRDRVAHYSELDRNCAENILSCARDEYSLSITEEQIHLLSGFGSGMCCGGVCGALAGSVAALGMLYVQDRMHASPTARAKVQAMVQQFNAHFGCDQCRELRPRYKAAYGTCRRLVEEAADILQGVVEQGE